MEYIQIRHAAQVLHEIETNAADTTGVQPPAFSIADRILDAPTAAVGSWLPAMASKVTPSPVP